MTRIQRRLLIDTSVIGVTMTLFVAFLAHFTRVLTPLDEWFYDQRARYCQYFTPPPTDKLVHVDIDDQAMEALGQWPWPRSQFAQIVDEITDAGAKAVFMDILFIEPSKPNPVRVGPDRWRLVDDDAILAAAIKRADNCLVPPALTLYENPSPVYRKLREYLTADLELNEAQCFTRLLADPERSLPPGSKFPQDHFLAARREAMNIRVSAEVFAAVDARAAEPTLEQLRAKLLPKTDPDFAGSPLLRLLAAEQANVLALRPIRRFMRPMPPGLPPLVKYATEQAPILPLSEAAAYTGSVDWVQTSASGTVRALPLMVEYRGALFPQTDLVLACATLGVDVNTIRVSPGEVTIPKPPGRDRDVVIPVRNVFSPKLGREAGLFMDIPVRGTREWEFMYDHQRFRKAELHLPILAVWNVQEIRQRIAKNNDNLDRALETVLADERPAYAFDLWLGHQLVIADTRPPRLALDPSKWKAYAAAPPPAGDFPTRQALIQWTLKELDDTGFSALATQKDSELPDPLDRAKRDELIAAVRTFRRVLDQNAKFDQQLQAAKATLRERINGKAVMIGWTATGKTDFVPTAIQPACPGVVIHGLVYNAIMTEHFWRHSPRWVATLLVLVIGLAVTAANGFLKPGVALVVTLALGVAYLLVNGLLAFDYGRWCVGVAGPMTALGAVWATGALAGFLIERNERALVTKRFSTYTDPKLVTHVLENADATLDGQVREMSVVFTDLAGFTSLSEQLRERTVPILSDYLGRMVPIIRRNDGFVNKFLGDGIMCFWNAPTDDPDHAAHAVQTVLEMQREMDQFVAEIREHGLPDLSMRCGVSTGSMVVGDSGPAEASDYTVLGDTVNFGSRLEGANKATGTKILISQRTAEMIDGKFLLRPVGKLQVVGKRQGVTAFEPIAFAADATDEQRALVARTTDLVAAYTAGDFQKCVTIADDMDEKFGPSKLAALYRRICQRFIEEPPGAAFDGNLILTEK